MERHPGNEARYRIIKSDVSEMKAVRTVIHAMALANQRVSTLTSLSVLILRLLLV